MGAIGRGTGGSGLENRDLLSDRLKAIFPELNRKAGCPLGCEHSFAGWYGSQYSLASIIVHLNNGHRWSRQRIAEWLANRELKFKDLPKEDKVNELQETGA